MEQKHRLAPGCIDLLPLYRHTRRPAEPEAADGAKGAIEPDVEDVIVHIGVL